MTLKPSFNVFFKSSQNFEGIALSPFYMQSLTVSVLPSPFCEKEQKGERSKGPYPDEAYMGYEPGAGKVSEYNV